MATAVGVTLPSLSVALATEFTVARLREFVTTTLSDSVLGTYLRSALGAVDAALGPLAVRERLNAGRGDLLLLAGRAASITSIVEDARWGALTLAVDDYELSDTGHLLYRLRTGTNPRWYWAGRVNVTYLRVDDPDNRIRVAIALVQLELTHTPGLSAQQIGTWSEAYSSNNVMNYQIERALILASLADQSGFIV